METKKEEVKKKTTKKAPTKKEQTIKNEVKKTATKISKEAKPVVKKANKEIKKGTKKVEKEVNELKKDVKKTTKKITKEAKPTVEKATKEIKKGAKVVEKETKEFVKEAKIKTEEILNDVKDDTKTFTEKDIENGRGFAIVAYILPFIPYFAEKNNKFVIYHAKQGMNLLVISMAYYIITKLLVSVFQTKEYIYDIVTYHTPGFLTLLINIGYLLIFILAIIGLINAINGKAKELPIINKIKIFK